MLLWPSVSLSFGLSMRGGLPSAALAGLLVLGAAPVEAQPAVQQVLVLQSFDRGNLVVDHFTSNFGIELDQRAGRPVNVVQVVVGPLGFVGAPEQAVVDYIRSIFTDGRKPDLIVTVSGPASVFARKHRRQLFPEVPLLLAAVDQRYVGSAPLGDNEAAVAVRNDYPGLVDDILKLLPETKQVFIVVGSGELGRFWRRVLEVEFQRFHNRLTFIWSGDLSLPEMLRRCASLPSQSAIFYLAFGSDAQGWVYADERVLSDLKTTANAPLFGVQSPYLGFGIVGGRLMAIDEHARHAADTAIRLLRGAPPASLSVPLQTPGQWVFDWRELERWGVPESRLPPDSVLRYRRPTLWQEYRLTVLGATAALTIQSLLIIGMLYERRARQRAETESRKNLALAADASRRQTMSALTSSIAHELGQPLSAMMYNAHALQMMVTANPEISETIGEILSDIQAQGLRATQIIDRHRSMLRSHQMDKKPIDLHGVVTESLTLVAHDMRARQVKVTDHLSSNPCVIIGDEVLLQQVFVNLVMNAMDAMASTPPSRRQVTIRSDVRTHDVDVSVHDTGPGLPEPINGTLFAPFVTTKSHGLGIGLTIVRTIVDAHGGTINAQNNPEGGATFTVTLRRQASHGPV